MYTAVLVIIIIFLLLYINELRTEKLYKSYLAGQNDLSTSPDRVVIDRNIDENGIKNLNVNIDMENICNTVRANGSGITDEQKAVCPELENESECVKEARKKCPKEKSLADQLFEQKQLFNNLKLQYEDTSPSYKFMRNDRYITDDNELLADDKLTIKMLDSGEKAQKSLTARALMGKNSFIPHLESELASAEAARWWDDDNLEAAF